MARSADNGATWSSPRWLNDDAEREPHPHDLLPELITDRSGHWLVIWWRAPKNKIVVAQSTDNGASWTSPETLGVSSIPSLPRYPDGMPQVATDRQGNWLAVWGFRDTPGAWLEHIYQAHSTDNGQTWSAPEDSKVIATYLDVPAQLQTDGRGNWLMVWLSYYSFDQTIGMDPDILVARSTDAGNTWSDAELLNLNGYTDNEVEESAFNDTQPVLATDGLGNWVLVWTSRDDLDGTITSDTDILVDRVALPDCNANGIGDLLDIAKGTTRHQQQRHSR